MDIAEPSSRAGRVTALLLAQCSLAVSFSCLLGRMAPRGPGRPLVRVQLGEQPAVFHQRPVRTTKQAFSVEEDLDVPALGPAEALFCLTRVPPPSPWIAVFGDSLSRGVFFDIVSVLNRSARAPWAVHPGHGVNYSVECTITEARPPTNRTKCGGFEQELPVPAPGRPLAPGSLRTPAARGAAPCAGHREGPCLRLTWRLKTFTWEPAFDVPSLRALATASTQPDVLLLSFGIWDMQYPPGGDPDPKVGLGNFNTSLRSFLQAFAAAFEGVHRPRTLWLTVVAVVAAKLPAWKRPRMDVERARAYNALAAPLMRAAGVEVVDTFTSSSEHPDLCKDGVHFPGIVSKHHSQLVLQALCDPLQALR